MLRWPADLEPGAVKALQPGRAIGVAFESAVAPRLILQSWSGGPGWVRLNPDSDDGRYAVFTWETMNGALGGFSRLNACQIRPWGADVRVDRVEVLESASAAE